MDRKIVEQTPAERQRTIWASQTSAAEFFDKTPLMSENTVLIVNIGK
jgi:hypothetical protein